MSAALLMAVLAALGPAHAEPSGSSESSTVEVVQASEVEWTYLNPARRDKAPMAGTLWGDRSGTVATGFLLKPKDGFESPPHIHNVTYRGVVIRGLIHNDDPGAAEMWMPAGSFWTQPKGEVHITAAKGDTLAYIEIGEGPYLVQPSEEAFDSGERSVNVDQTNIVWLNAADIVWIDEGKADGPSTGIEVAFLWGKRQGGHLNGTFIKLPAGFSGTLRSRGDTFRAVVIQGTPRYTLSEETKPLEPGSYFGATGPAAHTLSSAPEAETILYVRTNGTYDIKPAE
jgi:hypothetical protein